MCGCVYLCLCRTNTPIHTHQKLYAFNGRAHIAHTHTHSKYASALGFVFVESVMPLYPLIYDVESPSDLHNNHYYRYFAAMPSTVQIIKFQTDSVLKTRKRNELQGCEATLDDLLLTNIV